MRRRIYIPTGSKDRPGLVHLMEQHWIMPTSSFCVKLLQLRARTATLPALTPQLFNSPVHHSDSPTFLGFRPWWGKRA